MSAKHRVTINLDDPEYNDLQRLADAMGVSMAWVGRRAIADFTKAHKDATTPLEAQSCGSNEDDKKKGSP